MKNLTIFYHVAALNEWKAVVVEQFNAILQSEIHHFAKGIAITLNGNQADKEWIERAIKQANFACAVTLIAPCEPMLAGETPAVVAIEKHCKANPNEAIMYIHTKGVGHNKGLSSKIETIWRWTLTEKIIKDWKANLRLIDSYELVGWNWSDDKNYPPHFPGNMWFAQTNHLAKLPDFLTYQAENFGKITIQKENTNHPRFACEFWIGLGQTYGTASIYSKEIRNKSFQSVFANIGGNPRGWENFKELDANLKKYIAEKSDETLISFIGERTEAATEKELPKPSFDSAVIERIDNLFFESGSDKGFYRTDISTGKKELGHNYTPLYAELLQDPEKVGTLLEIGVQYGCSMRCWKELLPTTKLFGIDIDPQSKAVSDIAEISIFNVLKANELANFAANAPNFDVIIDDGGHRNDLIKAAFSALWGKLNSGGWYVIEDLHTAYPHWGKTHYKPTAPSTIQFIHSVINSLNRNGIEFDDHQSPYTEIRMRKSLIAIRKR